MCCKSVQSMSNACSYSYSPYHEFSYGFHPEICINTCLIILGTLDVCVQCDVQRWHHVTKSSALEEA